MVANEEWKKTAQWVKLTVGVDKVLVNIWKVTSDARRMLLERMLYPQPDGLLENEVTSE